MFALAVSGALRVLPRGHRILMHHTDRPGLEAQP